VQPPPDPINANTTFQLVLSNAGWDSAQRSCNALGGHLATYLSAFEQLENERFYIEGGYLLPTFHKFYWFGLRAPQGPGSPFQWVDTKFKVTPGSYRWATARGQRRQVGGCCGCDVQHPAAGPWADQNAQLALSALRGRYLSCAAAVLIVLLPGARAGPGAR
jgi:hypothetical protein